MNTLLLDEIQHSPAEVVPLTVEQYHRMLETGILAEGEPIELLDGLLVPKDRGEGMTIKPRHRLVVSRLMQLAARFEARGCHLQLQSPITIEPSHEPEPDGLVVRGGIEDYLDRHPGRGDVTCLIEVAESSLERDRTTKQRIYATAGVAQYVILNLVDSRAEVYEEPVPAAGRYESVRVLGLDDVISIRIPGGEALDVPVAQLIG
ncbi:MAG: Uma2 family endonuclease [bacterium]|nr:Uma2 family endonuclease [bacterium]